MKYVLVVLILFCSCTTQKKVTRYLNENTQYVAEYCGDKFPVKTDTMVIVESDTTLLKEYITEIDSIEIHDTICNATKERIKTIIRNNPPLTRTITIEKENTARITALQLRNQEQEKTIASLTDMLQKFRNQNKNLWVILIAIIVLTIVYAYFKYLR
jgi:hypothetical protein